MSLFKDEKWHYIIKKTPSVLSFGPSMSQKGGGYLCDSVVVIYPVLR